MDASGWEEKALGQCRRKAMVQQRGRLQPELIKPGPTIPEWIHRRWSWENTAQSQHLIRTWTSLHVNQPEDKSLLKTDFHKTTWITNLVILFSLALAAPSFLFTSRFYPRCLVAKMLGISTNYDKMCSFKSWRNMCEILVAAGSQLFVFVARGIKPLGTQADFTKLYSVLDLNQHASFQYWKDFTKFLSAFSSKDSKNNVSILLEGNWKTWGTGEELKHYFTTLIFFSTQCMQSGGQDWSLTHA